jgi:pimeloyl-ACP methyl ester carboxylesterase
VVSTLTRMNADIDIRNILPAIHVPTLILHSIRDQALDIAGSRYMADRIPGARLVELAGPDHLPWLSDADTVVEEIEV